MSNSNNVGLPDRTPVHKFKFYLTLENNVTVAEFTECSGLNVEREVGTPIVEGGVNDHVHIMPGRIKYSNITLKRGVTVDSEALWKWFFNGQYDLKVTRRDVSIILVNHAGDTVRQWDIKGAYPVKLSGPTLNASSNEAAIETLELAHHGLKLTYQR